ncbi:MAG TPA: tRNA (adenosine(37)-N6)-threonylcarbamoyltransferase complex ATPase subunit type 1 TsaE [Clostridia bacterium]|nr:tRNA (adenosine(37)-N6)-threonylcarbamoyltransferase complex ATPase subunit type 1 TsaE [Clostridia bacterium]
MVRSLTPKSNRILRVVTSSPEETQSFGRLLGSLLAHGDFVALIGELGAGKTCLAQGIISGLGVTSRVVSPSFNLIREYEGRLPVFHIDVYRLDDSRDMLDLDYEEYFYGSGVSIVEWADRIRDLLPAEHLEIRMWWDADHDPNTRWIEVKPNGRRYKEIVKALKERWKSESSYTPSKGVR